MITLPTKAAVKVLPIGNKKVPFDFPWLNSVHVSLLGDLSNLKNLQHELEQIKQLVNRDISKFKMNLQDFTIEITWGI
jgi:hypothetical protein